MRLIFWLSALSIAYVYVGYPALVAAWSRLRARKPLTTGAEVRAFPAISIVIAARNEAARLRARLENLLSLDYPGDRQIIVVSDGSTDATSDVVAEFPGQVDLVWIPPSGKASALNAGVSCAMHDVLVFADARQTFAPGAIRELVAPLADAEIGGVSGELLLDSEVMNRASNVESPVAEGIGTYWRFEKWVRRQESAIASTVGVTGAIYALRRSLWRPLPPETILDDVLAPMRAVLAGRRVVFTDRAIAFDRAASTADDESRRKTRTLAGNVQLLWLEPRLLVPFVNPVWLQFWSHKIGRLAMPYALLALMASSIALASQHPVYALALAAQCAFYLLAGYGACLEWRAASRAARAQLARRPTPAAASWEPTRPRKGVVNA